MILFARDRCLSRRFGRGLHDWEMYAATLTDPFEVAFFDQDGWYENSFRRTADGWKISRLKHAF